MTEPASTTPTRRTLRVLLPLVGVAIGVAVLHALYDLRAIAGALLDADPGWLAVALVLNVVAPLFAAGKVWSFARIAGEAVPWRRCWTALMAAVALNAVTPGRGGDLVRAVFLADGQDKVGVFLGTVLVERLVEVLALALLTLVVARADLATGLAAAAFAAAAVLLVALAHVPRWERVGRAARALPRNPGLAALGFGASLATWACNVALLGACLRAVGVAAPTTDILRAGPVAILAGIVPITVAGIGTRDTALATLLGGDGAAVVAGSFLYTAIALWLQGLIGAAALGTELLRAAHRARLARPEPPT